MDLDKFLEKLREESRGPGIEDHREVAEPYVDEECMSGHNYDKKKKKKKKS